MKTPGSGRSPQHRHRSVACKALTGRKAPKPQSRAFGRTSAGAFVGYHIAMLALGVGLVTSVVAAEVGAAVVLLVWRMAK